MTKTETKQRARLEIMHYLLEFCMTKHWPNATTGKYSPGIEGFVPAGYASTGPAKVGDLVIVTSILAGSKWQIGWLVDIDPGQTGRHFPRWLVESLEDGSLCWWTNVGLEFFPREKLRENPHWRWTDRQFAFRDRWNRVCYKERDAYIVLPRPPVFGDGFEVALGTRTRFGFDDIRPERLFPDWRKVTKAMMAEAYDSMVAEREQAKAA